MMKPSAAFLRHYMQRGRLIFWNSLWIKQNRKIELFCDIIIVNYSVPRPKGTASLTIWQRSAQHVKYGYGKIRPYTSIYINIIIYSNPCKNPA